MRRPHYDPDRHHRRSIRLDGYDYTRAGAYFVTICSQDRICLFGEGIIGDVRLNEAGMMAKATWCELPGHYPGVEIDSFVIMPNHIHGIVVLTAVPRNYADIAWVVGAGPRARPLGASYDRPAQPADRGQPAGGGQHADRGQPADRGQHADGGQPRGVAPTGLSLGDVVHRFKTLTTKRYADGVKRHGWVPFPGRLWQRNYYERIVRDDAALTRIRRYIEANPARWSDDPVNPTVAPEKGQRVERGAR